MYPIQTRLAAQLIVPSLVIIPLQLQTVAASYTRADSCCENSSPCSLARRLEDKLMLTVYSFRQTQFWDSSPAIGPADSWTLHGLWPDLCDGTYPTFCSFAPQYKNITAILEAAEQTDLLDYMNTYWLPNSGTAENFWEHEWNKHGTCINTNAPSCYGDGYTAGDEVVDFMNKAVEVFKVSEVLRDRLFARLCVYTQHTNTLLGPGYVSGIGRRWNSPFQKQNLHECPDSSRFKQGHWVRGCPRLLQRSIESGMVLLQREGKLAKRRLHPNRSSR